MTKSERNLGERWFEEVWNRGRREAIAEMLAPTAVVHDGGADTIGPDGFYSFFERINAAFSGLHVQIHDTMAENDKVCVRWSCKASHTGEGLGVGPTGKTIQVTGISILRVRDEMVVETWQNWDMLGMLEQLNNGPRSATYIGVD
jgi:steroid delta-isomerase-like uncharacterized protein